MQRDWNHASIFAWSVANEIKSSNDTGRTFVRTMMDYIRNQHDTTRFLTFSTNNDVVPAEASQYTDFVSRNSYQNFEKNHCKAISHSQTSPFSSQNIAPMDLSTLPLEKG
ncbi:glycoside hydrolase family 2 TIM barrel-domain containing protein [Psychrosphaera algicola]|uniref:Glycoside hydrolase family 2 TIM barrel-domain containing protein n=1 Tax=Psychrosphaera algicola TaxID=3023714 RepID=A0ABT5F7W9_9GAMM|nr:glycoside hydrolase family 2 TIM barrel-domain containing protein [Psychrosphaera sp. G1-22]MDC2887628.1 glycoside hydrolase family 2 TIM barrel-domain containing protein [Psychrosphaera sp. G1-22]